jgi:hypothetical protein
MPGRPGDGDSIGSFMGNGVFWKGQNWNSCQRIVFWDCYKFLGFLKREQITGNVFLEIYKEFLF